MRNDQTEIPIQPVAQPILCSPYSEPDRHWIYDRSTGIPSVSPDRRTASYWFRNERTGSAQQKLAFIQQEESDDLPLVNALRQDVKRWREAEWPGATPTTKALLRHWMRPDRSRRLFFCQVEAAETVIYLREMLAQGRKPIWNPVLTLDDHQALMQGQNPRPAEWVTRVAQPPTLIDRPHEPGLAALTRYALKMATGSGKTVVMALLLAWTFCNRGTSSADTRFPRRALVVCPNLTIRERLQVLQPGDGDNYFDRFDLVPTALKPALANGRVKIVNWHEFNAKAEEIRVGTVPIAQLGPETAGSFAKARLQELGDDEPVLVLNDEGHHAYRPAPVAADSKLNAEQKAEREEATVWVSGLDRIHAACGISFCVDLSATPFYIAGSGWPEGSPFPWIVSDFALVDAIESGITKIPRLPAVDNTGRPDPQFFKLWEAVNDKLGPGDRLPGGKPKPQAVYREAEAALLTLASQWKTRFEQVMQGAPGQDRSPPVLIVVCDNTDIAEHFHRRISGEESVTVEPEEADDEDDEDDAPAKRKGKAKVVKRFGQGLQAFPELANEANAERCIRIDSQLLAVAESGDPNATRKEAAEALRRVIATVGRPGEPGAQVRCVVSVNMLSEGWDANNVTHILGLRAFGSQLLCEQVVGRGLRRMNYTPDPQTGLLTEEYVDVFGVPFSLIPFKGRQPGDKKPPDDRVPHDVRAMPERAAMELRFPIVEGFIVDLKRNWVSCDVDRIERLRLDPLQNPTAAFIRPQVGYAIGSPSAQTGFKFERVTRDVYYEETHLQTIAFDIAREVVRRLTDSAHPASETLRRAGRAQLFPQVLGIVQRYIERRVDFNGLHPSELGLDLYVSRATDLLCAAIDPDEQAGELPLLPRLNRYRPIGSSDSVAFKTVKPVQSTQRSHVNFVAADTKSWEQAAATALEMLALEGVVDCYVRNDHLELTVPYEFQGHARSYEPDFLVKLTNGLHVLLEVKGQPHPETEAKHEAAKRWVRAVNRWAELGTWAFEVCWNTQKLGAQLKDLRRC